MYIKYIFLSSVYIFENWNTEADENGTSYETDARVDITEDLSIYAYFYYDD